MNETWHHFRDGERIVDFVLAYDAEDTDPENVTKRETFETNLENEGLQLEREDIHEINFVKIHTPKEMLSTYCDILKIKMPINESRLYPEMVKRIVHSFSQKYNFLFDEDSQDFFNDSIRIAIVQFILERQVFSNEQESQDNIGIEKLLEDGVYKAAYPLHDGDFKLPGSQRNFLFTEWASVKKWNKQQPLDSIKDYFGAKIALYFAWLGFYTHMLIPAAIVGILCFLYGLITVSVNRRRSRISDDICSSENNIVMCPQCEKCDYWHLKDTCIYSRINFLFDNDMTVLFACLMSFWAVVYLELWKRYSAKLIHRWGLTDFSHKAEHPRPQYLARLKNIKKTKFNVIHKAYEPYVPFWKLKFTMFVMSYSIVLLFVCFVVTVVLGIVVFRMLLVKSRNMYHVSDKLYYQFVPPIVAALFNLIVILILNFLYEYLAVYLTDIEYLRTQTEYDESFALKTYLFQFANYYSSIFYIAYLKGKFVGYPGKYNRIFGLRQEECNPGGCLMELCIQLIIIMVGKQTLNAMQEMLIPFFQTTYNSLKNKMSATQNEQEVSIINQWTNDYKLVDWSRRVLFDEYLEMIIQYGFITLFVVACPLVPFFALINNVFEIRLDAQKFLKYYRRPVPVQVKDIGVWYEIMSIVGRISIWSSAFIIAFSSNFIPRMVYMLTVNEDHTDEGFVNHTLSYFDPKDFETEPFQSAYTNVTFCRYEDYRNPPWSYEPYKRNVIYWHILAARLAFFVIFQNFVGVAQMIVAWAIPDVPRKLKDQIEQEESLMLKTIIEHERSRHPRNSNVGLKNVRHLKLNDIFVVPT